MLHKKYFHTYKTHIKLRWLNKSIIDVLCLEFTTRNLDYYLDALSNGVITVNGLLVPPSYKLKDLDLIEHTVHIHEPLPPEIEIIAKEENFWVVNKPYGIPCHPTGGYFDYSVTKILFKNRIVGCVNRLDMPVSGTLILTFDKPGQVHNLLKDAKKIYIAKVKGTFPDYIEVDKPIGLSARSKVHHISETGKPSKTIFEKFFNKDGYSLVKCQPITGRTHQIRIHMKHLGFPIMHDILYGDEELDAISDNPEYACSQNLDDFENKQKFECIIRHCKGANNRTFQIKDKFICLHAWKYIFDGKEFEAKWPEWAYF